MPDTGEYTESETEEQGNFYGELKTALCWNDSKHLSFRIRQFVETERKLELKYKGLLDTTTGDYVFNGHLRKNIYLTGTPSIEKVYSAASRPRLRRNDIDPDRVLPGGLKTLFFKDWVLGPGVSYDSTRQQHLRFSMGLKKSPQVLKHGDRSDLWLTGRCNVEVDPRTAEVSTFGALKVKMLKYNVTDKQDIKVCAGITFENSGKGFTHNPYLKISENNISARFQKKSLMFLYEL
eukprot:gene23516-9039_t